MEARNRLDARLLGIELYFADLGQGKQFYGNTLGLDLVDEQEGYHARFNAGEGFVCLERKGSETYPSRDKAVVFLEVPNLADAVRSIGEDKIVRMMPDGDGGRRAWAALHDPEGYNIVLVEAQPHTSSVRNRNRDTAKI